MALCDNGSLVASW